MNVKRQRLEKIILDKCKEAGCDKKRMAEHLSLFLNQRWNAHPPRQFIQWWEPWGVDEESGASKGGHPEAWRIWARKDEDGWKRDWYGIDSTQAYNTALFVDEYVAWLKVGAPRRAKDFISIAATLVRQKQFWAGLKGTLSQIAKPMPA